MQEDDNAYSSYLPVGMDKSVTHPHPLRVLIGIIVSIFIVIPPLLLPNKLNVVESPGKDPTAVTNVRNSDGVDNVSTLTRPLIHLRDIKLARENHSDAKLLVTGAAGFLGYHVIEALTSGDRTRMTAVDQFQESLDDDLRMKKYRALLLQHKYNVEVQDVDFCNAEYLRGVLQNGITHVLNLCEPIDYPPSSKHVLKEELNKQQECHETLFSVIQELTRHRIHSIPVVYLSSSMVKTDLQIDQKEAQMHEILIGRKKRAQEKLARAYYRSEGIPSLGLRLFSVYGPLCSYTSPLNKIGHELVYGAGRRPIHLSNTDFIFVKDLANSVVSLLPLFASQLPKVFSGLTIDMGSGENLKSSAVLKALTTSISLAGHKSPVEISMPSTNVSADKSNIPRVLGQLMGVTSFSQGVEEFAQWFDKFFFPKGYVLTSYLILEKDPQLKKAHQAEGSYQLIEGFYKTTHEVDTQVYILHDGLSSKFISKYETPRFIFINVQSLYNSEAEGATVKKYSSNNDRRFFYFRKFMSQLSHTNAPGTLPTYVMSSDLFDVRFRKNPFDFFDRHDSKSLFVGSEPRKFLKNKWMNTRMRRCNFSKEQKSLFTTPRNRYLLNAGIIGARWNVMQGFLRLVTEEFPKFNPKSNCNMPLVNYVGYRFFAGRLVTGPPLHSVFKSYNRRKHDVYIVHK